MNYWTALLLSFHTALAWANPDFPPTTLEEFERRPTTQAVAAEKGDYTMDMARPGFSVTFSYTGLERRMPAAQAKVIDALGKALGDSAFGKVFIRQIKVGQGNQDRWISTQSSLLPHLHKELKAGQMLRANLRLAGAAKGELVYIMIGYEALGSK